MASSNGRIHHDPHRVRDDDRETTDRPQGEEWRADDWRNNTAERGDLAQRERTPRPQHWSDDDRRGFSRGGDQFAERDRVASGSTHSNYGPRGYGYDDGAEDRAGYTRARAYPYGGQSGAQAGNLPSMRGPHHGKGPKNFQRSDERIREMVCEALTDHDDVDASSIDVQVKDGEVTLAGMIGDRRMKRLAEDVAERVAGVKDVHNALKITGDRTNETKPRP